MMQARNLLIALFAIAMASLIPLSGTSEGAAILLDQSSLSVSPEVPTHEGKLTVNATVQFIDAEPDKVTLKYSTCTDSYCGLDTQVEMTRIGTSNVWTATIGPFAEKDPNGDPYIDIKIHVLAKGNATDSEDDPEVDSGTKLVYFKELPKDDGEGKDSPAGLDISVCVIIGLMIALAIRSSRSRSR